MAYRALGDAGAVCRRFGVSRPTLRMWLRRYEQEGEAGLRARSRRPHRSPALKVGRTQEALILCLRQERRLGVKRLRNELQRLHELRLSAATIHKVLAQHGVSVLPTRKRVRHKPKRYERPVPGDRVQMGTCKIRPGLCQFAAIDDFPCGWPGSTPISRRHVGISLSGVGRDAVLDPARCRIPR